MHDPGEGPAAALAGDAPAPDSSRPRVLVVEDDLHDWKIYGKILWYNGYDVLHAANSSDGLRLAQRYRPDLVLLDLMLPDRTGIDLCVELKEDPDTRSAPVVLLTGRPVREFGDSARAAGCVDYLEKPIRPSEVIRRVRELIGPAPAAGEGSPPRRFSVAEGAN